MIYDHFAALAAVGSMPEKLDEYILKYHYLAATKKKKEAEDIKEQWRKNKAVFIASDDILAEIKKPEIDLTLLPGYSLIIQFVFELKTPYLSRGNQDFYMIDNPVLTDKVFRHPYIAASIWKGCLRSALWQLGNKEDTPEIRRLFGNEREEECHEALREGRLCFFPAFFTQKSLEVINPHDRLRKVGKNPILIEGVKQDTRGMFTLLYTPFDLISETAEVIQKQTLECLGLIGMGLKAMFLDYGFGAKTSSGFGIAKPEINGKFQIKANIAPIDIQNFDDLSGLADKVLKGLNSGRDKDGCGA
jgi:CRISPR-associated protein Cmr2